MLRAWVPGLVSLGLPVFNGENFIAPCIESILEQSYSNFELLISDNHSTDATSKICQDYQRRDPRIRYIRQATNLGAARNYNLVRREARGEFFKWVAHDDLLRADCLEESVRRLREQPTAVLCYSAVAVIDSDGVVIHLDRAELVGTGSSSPAQRFAPAVMDEHLCLGVYGVIRNASLAGYGNYTSYDGTDRAIIARWALQGPFVYHPEPLISLRSHPGRYVRSARANPRDVLPWWDPDLAGKTTSHTRRLLADYVHMVGQADLTAAERRQCYLLIARAALRPWMLRWVARDLVATRPAIYERLRVWKRSLLGSWFFGRFGST